MTFARDPRPPRRARQLLASAAGAMLLVLALVLPALAALPPGPTKLLTPDVSPRTADSATPITFSVTYRNAHDQPPEYVRVAVSGTRYGMTGSGTDWKGGVLFTVTTTLPAGSHDVVFEALDAERFVDQAAGGTVTIDPAPAPDPTPTPTPTATPTPTPSGGGSGGTGGSGGSGGSSGSGGSGTTTGTSGSTTGAEGSGDADPAHSTGAGTSAGAGDGEDRNWTGPGISGPWYLVPTINAGASALAGAPGSPTIGPTTPAAGDAGARPDGLPGFTSEASEGWIGGAAGSSTAPGWSRGGSFGGGSSDSWLEASFDGGLAVLGLAGPGHMPTLPAVVAPTIMVTTWMAFMLFNKRRRDGEPPAPDGVLQAAAATGVGMGPVFAQPVPADPELLMPRWRRPSLLEARKMDPVRAPGPARPRLTFAESATSGDAGIERRIIRYAVIPLLDRPDEIMATRIGELVEGDEVEVQQRSGAYCHVLSPDGRQGWVHRTTLGDAVVPEHHLAGRAGDPGPDPDGENALAALLAARGLR